MSGNHMMFGNRMMIMANPVGCQCRIATFVRKMAIIANPCLTKDKGKVSAVNMVTAEVQQVTTRSKAKQSEWDVQEAVSKATKERVKEANNNNVTRMLQESNAPNVTADKSGSRQEEAPTDTPDDD